MSSRKVQSRAEQERRLTEVDALKRLHAGTMLNSRAGWTRSRINDAVLWARNHKGTDPNPP